MSRADELVELLRGRIHSEFDGECHLTDTEAHAIADFLSEAEQRVQEARRIALEEAAKIVEQRLGGLTLDSFVFGGIRAKNYEGHEQFLSLQRVEEVVAAKAAAIRALIPSEPQPEKYKSQDDAEGRV